MVTFSTITTKNQLTKVGWKAHQFKISVHYGSLIFHWTYWTHIFTKNKSLIHILLLKTFFRSSSRILHFHEFVNQLDRILKVEFLLHRKTSEFIFRENMCWWAAHWSNLKKKTPIRSKLTRPLIFPPTYSILDWDVEKWL